MRDLEHDGMEFMTTLDGCVSIDNMIYDALSMCSCFIIISIRNLRNVKKFHTTTYDLHATHYHQKFKFSSLSRIVALSSENYIQMKILLY